MLNDLETIRRAGQALSIRKPDMADELLQATERIWKRIYSVGRWPRGLAERAAQLADRLTREGSIEATLDQMDEQEAAGLGNDIIHFAEQLNEIRKAVV